MDRGDGDILALENLPKHRRRQEQLGMSWEGIAGRPCVKGSFLEAWLGAQALWF